MGASPSPLPPLPDSQAVTLGSGPADVRVAGDGVAPVHVRLVRRAGGLLVQDLDSPAGTFVNGTEVRGLVPVRPGDVIRLGAAEFTVPAPVGGGSAAGLAVTVDAASKVVRGGRAVLDGVSVHVPGGRFVGVLGASGSGKSTLMKAVAGLDGLTAGAVRLDGAAVPPARLRLDRRIAYLPQDVVIHEALTPAVALDYAARLKGVGADPAGRAAAVAAALDRVGLGDRAGVPIHRLSGGQRKRAALAAELLGNPGLLLLDEATSGLDPATEGEMMALFRSLADEGRTVLVVTHFPGRLDLCDLLVVMGDGRCVFQGTPAELRRFFGVAAIEDVYPRLRERPAGDWHRLFADRFPGRQSVPPPAVDPPPEPPRPAGRVWPQTADLAGRYARVQLADWRNLVLLVAQAPAIGLMVGGTFGAIRVPFAEQHAADAKQVLFLLVVAVLWCAGTASVREVVKERAVVRHEARFGLDLRAYLLSKVLFLGAVGVAQAALLLATVRWLTGLVGPPDLQFLVLVGAAVAGVALGLCVSAGAGTSERAMTALPVALIGQAVFSGGLARLAGPPLWAAWLLAPAYWALDGLKAPLPTDLKIATYPGAPGYYQPPILGPGGPLAADLLALAAQAAALLAAAYLLLRRTTARG